MAAEAATADGTTLPERVAALEHTLARTEAARDQYRTLYLGLVEAYEKLKQQESIDRLHRHCRHRR